MRRRRRRTLNTNTHSKEKRRRRPSEKQEKQANSVAVFPLLLFQRGRRVGCSTAAGFCVIFFYHQQGKQILKCLIQIYFELLKKWSLFL